MKNYYYFVDEENKIDRYLYQYFYKCTWHYEVAAYDQKRCHV